MAGGRILAVCQSGGEFITKSDGSMSYSGGEAHAIDIDREMSLDDLKSEISSMFNCSADTFSIKYFLPKNKRTLITISSDKDLQRMVDFQGDSDTTDIYVLKKVEKRLIRSVVADSGTPTDATIAILGTPEETNRQRVFDEETKRQRVCNDWDNMITGVGQTFDGPKAFRDALHKYAIANSFMYRFIKNDTLRVTAECTSENCPWRIHASRATGKQELVIKKMNDNHTCEREPSKECRRLASQRWVASVIKERLRSTPNYKPRDIANDLQREYGLSLDYTQAWRGRFFAKKELHNSREEACNQLPWFCERIMETNPGSFATLLILDDSRFRLFIAFHASLSGFEHGCRPLLFLDGITLKANKQWKLLTATAVDGENAIFPVAFSVVDTESQEDWHWFLMQLKLALSMSHTITFVSNWRNGLEEEVRQIFEGSNHGYSVHRLIEDFKAGLKSSWTQERKDAMVDSLKRSVDTCKVDEFNECIENIRTESKECAEWVMSTKPEFWANVFFKGLRYGAYSSNAAETFNSWVSARHEPSVVQMIDMIRCKLMEMIYIRRESSNTWTEMLTPWTNQKVQEEDGKLMEMVKSRNLNVICSTGSLYQVSDDDSTNEVNIEAWECTCRRWRVTGLPCVHALAVLERTDGCVSLYCSKYFTTECYRLTYSLSIIPIPDAGRPPNAEPVNNIVIPPRRARRRAGRPKQKPADPRVTIKRAVRCSQCKAFGHNKQTCKASV